jgi:hypothetical protein
MDHDRQDLIIRTLRREDVGPLVRLDQEISRRARQAWYEQKRHLSDPVRGGRRFPSEEIGHGRRT